MTYKRYGFDTRFAESVGSRSPGAWRLALRALRGAPKFADLYPDSLVRGLAVALTFILLTSACGSGDPPTVPDPLATRVAISDSLPSVFAGDTLRLYASSFIAGVTADRPVAWTSANPGLASVADGLVTAVAPGLVRIRATVDTATTETDLVVLPVGTRPASQLAYTQRSGSAFHIRVANLDGTIVRTTPSPPAAGVDYGWSRDGSLFYSQSHTGTSSASTIVDANHSIVYDLGATMPQNTRGGGQFNTPDISPDGTKLLYLRGAPGARQVEIMTLATRAVSLHSFVGTQFFARWSPDGRRWAIVRKLGSEWRLVVVRTEGATERILGPAVGGDAKPPEWSPDGRYIAMALSSSMIWLGTADGRFSTTIGGCGTFTSGCTINSVTWSPDGKRLAFWRTGQPGLVDELVVRPIFGVSETVVASGREPAWSPDGQWLAFVTTTDSPVQMVRPDGTGAKPLNGDTGVWLPIWR